MGNDVIDGTTKSVEGAHSSLTSLFVTAAHAKRHLPDIYVQRWMGGAHFDRFNPRETDTLEAAKLISESYGFPRVEDLSVFFLDRSRHEPPMDELNRAGIATPYDKDGDLLPAVLLGLDGLQFSNGHGLHSMVGEIGGSAEWAVGVLPLVWRGGQAIGMLTSQSTLTRKDLSAEEKWRERFHFTEEEFIVIQDARFERKPYFTIWDIMDEPFAGGISAFGAITDCCYLPVLEGVKANPESGEITVNTLVVNSLGITDCWRMVFQCQESLERTASLFASPKDQIEKLSGNGLQRAVGEMVADERKRQRLQIFFNNEYYPALIPVRDKLFVLNQAIDSLIDRGALTPGDREIIAAVQQQANDWFAGADWSASI
jgi:fructose-1,6-bisphosphatase/sedoheptulose 1,7-bisphosphatase-like protein